MSHVYCPECGFQNPETANYCSRCGALSRRRYGHRDDDELRRRRRGGRTASRPSERSACPGRRSS